jgi:hypothetical protein
MLRSFAVLVAFACALGLSARPSLAQTASEQSSSVQITVNVTDAASGAPIANAAVTLRGPRTLSGRTTAGGATTLSTVQGLYDVTVSSPGYNPTTVSGEAVTAGSTNAIGVTLVRVTFNSLRSIGHVYVSASGSLNTSTSSLNSVNGGTLLDRGQVQLRNALDQIPGVINGGGYELNSAAPGAITAPQVRGGLPYETESLIDGHPIALASSGSYDAAFLTAYMLDNIEVAKGPGVFSDTITGAVNGTVNYRTLSPTHARQESIDLGTDSYGGELFNARATGSVGKLGYAFDYASDGTPGPLNNAPAGSAYLPQYGGSLLINGKTVCGAAGIAGCPVAYGTGNPAYAASTTVVSPIAACCVADSTAFFVRNQLGKLSYSFSPSTTLTLSDLNLQDRDLGGFGGDENYQSFVTFSPPAGYTGSAPANTSQPFPLTVSGAFLPYRRIASENFLQGDLRTTVGKATILARAYNAAIENHQVLAPGPANTDFTVNLYGAIPLGTPPVLTHFNGQSATLTEVNFPEDLYERDDAYGETIDISQPIGNGTYAISYDNTASNGFLSNTTADPAFNGVYIPDGSSQRIDTLAARAFIELTPKLSLNAAEYLIGYSDNFSPDGGKSYERSASHSALPRAALAWRATRDTSVRFSAGGSLAPPYLSLITAAGTAPQPNNQAAPTYYTQTLASGNVLPETAFGYDVGIDQRLRDGIVVTTDAYLTNLRNQYLQTTFLNGTYSGNFGTGAAVPLYDQITTNLGNSRYEGLELAVRRDPALGVGFLAQGTLMRAYPYAINPSLYATANGAQTTNLAVIPNVNFRGSGNGYNALGYYGAVPYATGYGELTYKWPRNRFARFGVTYYGNNNQYNLGAFEIVSASAGLSVGKASIILSADNIFDTHSDPYITEYKGTPVPLVNGLLGATFGGTYGPPTARLTVHVPLQ